MRRRTGQILLLVLMLAVLFNLGFSQSTSKIGAVNSQEVLEKSVEGKKIMAQLEERNKKNQDQLAKLDNEINQLQSKLNTQRLTLTNEAMMQLNSDIEKKQTERKRMAEDTYREMQEFTQRLFQKMQGELIPIIEQVGQDRGLDMIFDLLKSGAIYFSPTIDLTEEVIKRYDAAKAQK